MRGVDSSSRSDHHAVTKLMPNPPPDQADLKKCCSFSYTVHRPLFSCLLSELASFYQDCRTCTKHKAGSQSVGVSLCPTSSVVSCAVWTACSQADLITHGDVASSPGLDESMLESLPRTLTFPELSSPQWAKPSVIVPLHRARTTFMFHSSHLLSDLAKFYQDWGRDLSCLTHVCVLTVCQCSSVSISTSSLVSNVGWKVCSLRSPKDHLFS